MRKLVEIGRIGTLGVAGAIGLGEINEKIVNDGVERSRHITLLWWHPILRAALRPSGLCLLMCVIL
jgi:hypothetical protein